MIDFQKLTTDDFDRFQEFVPACQGRGCEYSFVNLSIWGRQRVAFLDGFLVLFSQFGRSSVYPFPLGKGDVKPILDAIIHDARMRGIPCRITSLTKADCDLLEALYPGQFRFHADRDHHDYVYTIEALASLSGKRYQSKRNFANRFNANHPDAHFLPLDDSTEGLARSLVARWCEEKLAADPLADFVMEQTALDRAFRKREALGLEGLVLMAEGQCVAMTMGSRLSPDTFDIHFEKAISGYDGAYAAINRGFARHLMEKYPEVKFLNREDDMGIEGLRKAKLSYHPDHLVEKYWARLWEADDEH